MDSQRITELRREIEALQEASQLYRAKKYHRNSQDEVELGRRLVRLQEIKKELDGLRKKPDAET